MKIKLWHYTSKLALDKILESEVIKLATEGVPKGEKPGSWFSSNSTWENTVTKLLTDGVGNLKQLSFDEMSLKFGCARIEIEFNNNIMTFAKFKHKSKMTLATYESLIESGINKGANPNEWYVSLKPITIDNWIKAEIWENGSWVLYDEFIEDTP